MHSKGDASSWMHFRACMNLRDGRDIGGLQRERTLFAKLVDLLRVKGDALPAQLKQILLAQDDLRSKDYWGKRAVLSRSHGSSRARWAYRTQRRRRHETGRWRHEHEQLQQ